MFQSPKNPSHYYGGELILSKRLKTATRTTPEDASYLRIRRKKSWGDDGVAATVGTLLSLMVFLTFLGMFTNQYVPIWMKDNENNHMNEVISEISNMKSSIDMQILSSNEMVASAPIYSPIQLHADGVPIFASPTMGELGFVGAKSSSGASAWLSYNYSAGGVIHTLNQSSGAVTGGSLMFNGPNRYFVQQSVIYENGAVILNQTNGEVVLAGISIKITPSGSSNMVLITFTSLIGDDKTIGGYGTKSVTTAVDYSSYTKVNNSASATNTLTLSLITAHGAAWSEYFTTVLNGTEVTSNWKVREPVALTGAYQGYSKVVIILENVATLEFTKAVVSVAIADIGV
jgi:hypothetical protein